MHARADSSSSRRAVNWGVVNVKELKLDPPLAQFFLSSFALVHRLVSRTKQQSVSSLTATDKLYFYCTIKYYTIRTVIYTSSLLKCRLANWHHEISLVDVKLKTDWLKNITWCQQLMCAYIQPNTVVYVKMSCFNISHCNLHENNNYRVKRNVQS